MLVSSLKSICARSFELDFFIDNKDALPEELSDYVIQEKILSAWELLPVKSEEDELQLLTRKECDLAHLFHTFDATMTIKGSDILCKEKRDVLLRETEVNRSKLVPISPETVENTIKFARSKGKDLLIKGRRNLYNLYIRAPLKKGIEPNELYGSVIRLAYIKLPFVNQYSVKVNINDSEWINDGLQDSLGPDINKEIRDFSIYFANQLLIDCAIPSHDRSGVVERTLFRSFLAHEAQTEKEAYEYLFGEFTEEMKQRFLDSRP